MNCRHLLSKLAAAWACALALGTAAAGDFTVNPVRLELGPLARTGALVIRNDGNTRLAFQLRGMSWTQDAKGQDQYTDADDLVYFPRVLTVEGGQEAVVRVGVRQSVVETEKTYRLFIEELPLPGAEGDQPRGPALTLLVRFGAPIFVKPARLQDRLDIAGLQLAGGTAQMAVRNGGNQHQIVESIQVRGLDAAGNEAFAITLSDRYLLAGTAKPYNVQIPATACARLARLRVEVRTDKASANAQAAVDSSMCQ